MTKNLNIENHDIIFIEGIVDNKIHCYVKEKDESFRKNVFITKEEFSLYYKENICKVIPQWIIDRINHFIETGVFIEDCYVLLKNNNYKSIYLTKKQALEIAEKLVKIGIKDIQIDLLDFESMIEFAISENKMSSYQIKNTIFNSNKE